MLIRSNQAFPNCIPPIAMCAPKSASSSKSSATSASSNSSAPAPIVYISFLPQSSTIRSASELATTQTSANTLLVKRVSLPDFFRIASWFFLSPL